MQAGYTQHLQSTRRRQESSLRVGTTGPVAGRSIRPQQPQASATATRQAGPSTGSRPTESVAGLAAPCDSSTVTAAAGGNARVLEASLLTAVTGSTSASVLRVAATRRRFARGAGGSEGRLVQVATVAVADSGGVGKGRGDDVPRTEGAAAAAHRAALYAAAGPTPKSRSKSGDESGDASGGGGDLRQARLAAGACAAGACAADVSVAASTRGRVAALRTMAA